MSLKSLLELGHDTYTLLINELLFIVDLLLFDGVVLILTVNINQNMTYSN